MYANLAVKVGDKEMFAWKVTVDNGALRIELDSNTDGNYAEPAGLEVIPLDGSTPPVTIRADF